MAISVILLVRMWVEKLFRYSITGTSPSSSLWGCELKNNAIMKAMKNGCHPPCEDVSWKIPVGQMIAIGEASSSLWGCELKNTHNYQNHLLPKSSSLWGCELKSHTLVSPLINKSHPPCEDVSWKFIESKCYQESSGHPPCEDVSWKDGVSMQSLPCPRHPPCGDVSWKIPRNPMRRIRHMSSSLWGCELKREWCKNVWYSCIALLWEK